MCLAALCTDAAVVRQIGARGLPPRLAPPPRIRPSRAQQPAHCPSQPWPHAQLAAERPACPRCCSRGSWRCSWPGRPAALRPHAKVRVGPQGRPPGCLAGFRSRRAGRTGPCGSSAHEQLPATARPRACSPRQPSGPAHPAHACTRCASSSVTSPAGCQASRRAPPDAPPAQRTRRIQACCPTRASSPPRPPLPPGRAVLADARARADSTAVAGPGGSATSNVNAGARSPSRRRARPPDTRALAEKRAWPVPTSRRALRADLGPRSQAYTALCTTVS